jgi:hypothetical protein
VRWRHVSPETTWLDRTYIMTDWEVSLDDREPGSACIALVNAAVWLICAPFDLYARLRNGRSTTGDDAGQAADWGREGSFETHNGGGQ